MDQGQDSSGTVTGIILVFALLYLIPSLVAFLRRHPNRWPILLINIALGGTILGWFGALIWAMHAIHKSPTGSQGGESGLNIFANDPTNFRLANDWRDVPAQPPMSSTPVLLPPSPRLIEDPATQLAKLKKLHDDGIIDDFEFRRLRQPYVDQMTR